MTTASISGTVIGPDAAPLADIQVEAYGNNAYYGASTADGTYSIDVSAGSYVLYFYDKNAAHPAGFYSATGFTADYHDATEVVVGADVTGIDIQLPSPIWIKGTVTGPGGIPIGQISVGASSMDLGNGGTTKSADDGTYAIAVTPGTYYVGFADEAGTYASGYYGSSGYTASQSSAAPVTVTAADVTGIDAQLPLAIHISGVVTSPAGAPLQHITVLILGDTSFGIGTTAADGSYSVVAAADSYYVAFVDTSNTYPTGYYSTSGYKPDPTSATKVVVTTADVPHINLRFPTPIYIRGNVTDLGTLPLEGITVYAQTDTFGGTATTAADGAWSIPVVAGSYLVSYADDAEVYAPGYYSHTGYQWDPALATPVVVTTANATGVNVQLPLAPHIEGVITGPGDVALAQIEVTAYGSSGTSRTVTDADGKYSVAASHGSYHIAVRDPAGAYVSGYYASTGFTTDSNAASPIPVASADVTGINMKLPAPVYLRGTVTGPGGVPLKGIDVTANSIVYSADAITAADGTFAISVVAATYHVSYCDVNGVYGSGYYSEGGLTTDPNAASPVEVSTSDELGLDVELPMAIHITGTVTGDGGAPLSGIDVFVQSGSMMTDTMTDPDGTYSVVVVSGSYNVSFFDETMVYQSGYYSSGGFTTDGDAATPVTVADADVPGIDVQMVRVVLPTPHIGSLPTWAATTSIAVRWSATPGTYGVDGYDVRVRRAPWNGTFGSYATWKGATTHTSATYTGAAGSTYCFSARAIDYYGLTSDWTAETCTAVPLDDRSLTRSTGWTAKTGSAYYKSTYLLTTRLGAKLTASKVVAQRIAVVATTCPTCGTIKVYWGSTLLKTISLKSATTVNKKVIAAIAFTSPRTGTLVIKVASSGKKMIIDGVVIRQTGM